VFEGDNIVIKTLKDMGVSIEQIKSSIDDQLEYGPIKTDHVNIPFTQQAKQALANAWDEARKLGHNYVNVEHLFLSLFRDSSSIGARVLAERDVNITKFREHLFNFLGSKVDQSKRLVSTIPTPTLDLFGRDLTQQAKEKKLDPVVGRNREIQRIVQILCRRSKNNPVLTGDPGSSFFSLACCVKSLPNKSNVGVGIVLTKRFD
jgi:ATP-dependent Clp protease ATP-binding subunit ClpC